MSSQPGTRGTVEARTWWAFLAGAKAMEETLLEAESDRGNAPMFPPISGQGHLLLPPQHKASDMESAGVSRGGEEWLGQE